MTHTVLLKHLDSPVRILSLSIQDFIGYAVPFFVGALFDSLLIIPVTGLIAVYCVKRALKSLPKFYLIRYMYWAFPTSRYNKIIRVSLPISSKRFWVK